MKRYPAMWIIQLQALSHAHTINARVFVDVARAKNNRREVRLKISRNKKEQRNATNIIDGVGKGVCFATESHVRTVPNTILANTTCVQKAAGIELQTNLVGDDFEHNAAC